ncbi:hypothetical protein [Bartonella raoultii]|nr:hypothetical protein [Bartonella raoultii]
MCFLFERWGAVWGKVLFGADGVGEPIGALVWRKGGRCVREERGGGVQG